VVGDAFLRGMVRRIVAALLRVGRGRASAADVTAALGQTEPAFNGEAAAPRGLTLWRVPMGPPHERHRRGVQSEAATDNWSEEQDNQW
jgi:tRNA U38,U39,U40 pseudouridine synthase TruA